MDDIDMDNEGTLPTPVPFSQVFWGDESSVIPEESGSSDSSNWDSATSETQLGTSARQHTACLDVAAYVLRRLGPMSAMKLQKLVYYSQAWSLVWDEEPLFSEPVEAWANGPVVRRLFNHHRGHFRVDRLPAGNPRSLDDRERETVDAVLDFYGKMSAQELIDLSHSEKPWRDAREGLALTERGNRKISQEAMAEYYSSLR